MNPLRIVFMGTPDFAVTILKKIHESNHEVVGVVTAVDKPAGRGQKLQQSAVKVFASENNLHILQPEKLKADSFVEDLKALQADLFVVVAFRMLPEVVWSMPALGTVNLHASLLPQYRGAAPINWAIINGETETGVTSFFIEKEIDTGKILLNKKCQIASDMTAGELHDQLADMGAKVIHETIDLIASREITAIDQEELISGELRHAPKIFKEDCLIDWSKDAKTVHNQIRGLSPYPAAWTFLDKQGKKLQFKLFKTQHTDKKTQSQSDIQATAEGLLFPCGDNYLLVTELQMEGKRRMTFKEFLAGNDIHDYKIEG